MSNIAFVPFVRRGLATGITRPEEAGAEDPRAAATFDVNVEVKLASPSVSNRLEHATATVALISPGDVVALHTDAIVRVSPGRDESDAEYQHFPAVELDQPDLPWRYTPFAANGDKLKPWLVLLVLSETDAEFDYAPVSAGKKLPVVTVHAGVGLPDLVNQSWAWAHVQFNGALPATPKDVETLLQRTPSRAVARILSPRILEPQKAYRAFLVPAFEHGRRAGLGQPIGDGDVSLPSFPISPTANLELPVYYDWRFQTGILADFQQIVRELVPSPVPQEIATRALDVSGPGYNLPKAASTGNTLPIAGALKPLPPALPPPPPTPPPPTVSTGFIAALKAFIESSGKTLFNPPRPDLLVTPPLYGRWHGAQGQLDAAANGSNPPWFFQLNSDPRNRVGAALGTAVVQKEQQNLMASAWRQLGSLKAANVERRVLQVGREAFIRLYQRHLTSGTLADMFLLLTGPLHARIPNGPGATIHSLTDGSRVGRQLFDPQWRRFARRRGRIGRSQGRHLPGGDTLFTPLSKLNDPTFEPAPEPPVPDGMATDDVVYDLFPGGPTSIDPLVGLGSNILLFWGILLFCVSRRFLAANAGVNWWWLLRVMRFGLSLIRLANGRAQIDAGRGLQGGTLDPTQIAQTPTAPGFQAYDAPLPVPFPATAPVGTGSDSDDAKNFRAAFGEQMGETNAGRLPIPVLPPLQIPAVFDVIKTALHPSLTLLASIFKRLTLPPGYFQVSDKLEPIMAAPEFPQPVWTGLRDQSPDWILPGLDRIGTNTVGLCVPNQPFIEAYMVGLNHEMSRELLWNEYPTDQRGTYFRQFWDVRGNLPGGSAESIVHIHSWGRSALGQNAPAAADPNGILVLLVRGDVIRRYPNVLVYAAEVDVTAGEPKKDTEQFPLFTGRLGGDVAFYGFKLDIATARGTPGRYFVLQEQPAEPRFDPPTQPLPLPPGASHYVTATDSSASFAIARYQRPTRVAIHAGTLTPPQS
jgi:hypothetical protein